MHAGATSGEKHIRSVSTQSEFLQSTSRTTHFTIVYDDLFTLFDEGAAI